MIVGIDGNEANVLKKVGISEFAYRLLEEMYKLNPQGVEFIIYLKAKPNEDLPLERENWKYKVIGPSKFWTQFALPLNLFFSKRPHVFLTLTHYAPRFSPIPTVISIMDLSYLFFPELFRKDDLYQLKNWTKYSAQKAAKIITISKSTKNDIIKEYRIDETKVKVVYLGIKNNLGSMNKELDINKKFQLASRYILFVGTLQPRKNLIKLIESFSILKNNPKNKDVELVIVGKKGWLYEEILEAPKKYEVTPSVKFLDFVSDDDLPSLYKNAQCYVLPSLYEGFGLPVLEAMKYGCPVITSNVSSLPEAGGEAALYVDPMNSRDIAEKIERLLGDKKLQQEMKRKGFDQVKKFSWEKAAKETLKVLKEVGSRSEN